MRTRYCARTPSEAAEYEVSVAAGAETFTALAMGEREDVLFDVGNQNQGKHEANGVAWYYSNSYSMGFARGGDPVTRQSCDTNNQNPSERMCWTLRHDAQRQAFEQHLQGSGQPALARR